MLYHSTRNHLSTVNSAQAVLSGLAPDGGLYSMRTLALLDFDWQATLKKDTFGMAVDILTALLPDFSREEMEELVKEL